MMADVVNLYGYFAAKRCSSIVLGVCEQALTTTMSFAERRT